MIKLKKSHGYLQNSVSFEPTIGGWYAWIQLLPPHTASLNFLNRYIPILESFINFPELHAQAASDPKLFAGPYANLSVLAKEKIQHYLEVFSLKANELFKLATAIIELNKEIANFTGKSFDALYVLLPDNLRDCIELVYNEFNKPSIRYIEPLLYKKFFNILATMQSFHVYPYDNSRSFVLSTPRVSSIHNGLEINIPFKNKVYDELFGAASIPIEVEDIAEKLAIQSTELDAFKGLFHEEKLNKLYQSSDELTLKYFGHACVLIESRGKSILIDPLIHSVKINSQENKQSYTYDDLPEKIDYVLITHSHHDHFNIETLLRIRHKIGKIIVPQNNNGSILDPSLKFALTELGFKDISSLEEFDTIGEDSFKITALPFWGEHADFDIRSKTIYLVSVHNKNIMFATDMNYINDISYNKYIDCIKQVDALFIGTEFVGASADWLYGSVILSEFSHQNKFSRRLCSSNAEKGYKLAKTINAKSVYIYALGQEPWLSHIMGMKHNTDSLQSREADKLVHLLSQDGICAKKLYWSDNINI